MFCLAIRDELRDISGQCNVDCSPFKDHINIFSIVKQNNICGDSLIRLFKIIVLFSVPKRKKDDCLKVFSLIGKMLFLKHTIYW